MIKNIARLCHSQPNDGSCHGDAAAAAIEVLAQRWTERDRPFNRPWREVVSNDMEKLIRRLQLLWSSINTLLDYQEDLKRAGVTIWLERTEDLHDE